DSPAPSQPSAPVNGEDVPERASAQMAGEPAAPTQAGSSAMTTPANDSTSTTPTSTTPSATTPGATTSSAPSSAPSFGYQPRAQVAAWDLPPSSIPPMGGRASL